MFTVKQISRMAGVTPRTLRYYDQIGLLKPSRIGENGYRYYGEEALLRLQQIMLYRDLEMPLEEIKAIVNGRDFDVLTALEGHRSELQKRIRRMQRLVQTVDDTIEHLKGNNPMSENQFFAGFSEEQQAEYEKEAMQMYDPETVRESNRKWKNYSSQKKEAIFQEGNRIYLAFVDAMPQGSESQAAQECVRQWRGHMDNFWTPNDEQCLGLADLYNDDPRFKATFDRIHPDLASFIRQAVRVHVQRRQA